MAQTELTKENIGEIIKELRKESGINQEELGWKVGVAKQTIMRVETGQNSPSSNLLIDIANTLGKKVIIK